MKSGEGISLQYVFVWIVGDIFNLVGCIYTEQLPTQVCCRPANPKALYLPPQAQQFFLWRLGSLGYGSLLQVYLACWYIFLDCIILAQIGYYDIYLGRSYQRIILEPWMYENDIPGDEVVCERESWSQSRQGRFSYRKKFRRSDWRRAPSKLGFSGQFKLRWFLRR
jgi:hypothetical protein